VPQALCCARSRSGRCVGSDHGSPRCRPLRIWNLISLEHATSVDEALALARVWVSSPELRGWRPRGPHRVDHLRADSTDIGAERSNGHSPWTTAETHPRIVDPAVGRIWTANARVTDDEAAGGRDRRDLASLGSDMTSAPGRVRSATIWRRSTAPLPRRTCCGSNSMTTRSS